MPLKLNPAGSGADPQHLGGRAAEGQERQEAGCGLKGLLAWNYSSTAGPQDRAAVPGGQCQVRQGR